jgi:choline dehydrogenase-like flavoprotein
VDSEHFGAIVVGTGFASSFFLLEYLRHAPADARVLVLERGKRLDPVWKLTQAVTSDVRFVDASINRTPQKGWVQNIAFGGGSCWTGNTPRMHPNDFRTRTLYGVGTDWPIDYDTLEPYYQRVEDVMCIAGGAEGPFRRSKPYPSPAHRLNALDDLLASRYPGKHIPMPSARSSSEKSGRPLCCANGVCSTCPIMAKFQVDLHMKPLYEDPRVTLRVESNVDRIDIQGDVAKGVHYVAGGKEHYVKGDLVAVGAHAIMTPFILLKSGLADRALGRYLNEQVSLDVQVNLDGVDNYGGGQAVTGLGVMFLDGDFRKQRAGCLLENWNVPWLRAEPGRWRHRGLFKFVFEDVPAFENHVSVAKEDPSKPAMYYPAHSAYMKAGFASVPRLMDELAGKLPIESFQLRPIEGLGGSAHIQGTTRMGTDPNDSVVDAKLLHHRVRNLAVLGGGAFPTCPAANPTLTLSALSMRAAEQLFS